MWKAILAGLAAVVGMILFGNRRKNQDVDHALEEAEEKLREDQDDAKRRYEERLERARGAADASVADRPHTDDPLADLRDRLDR